MNFDFCLIAVTLSRPDDCFFILTI